MYYRTDIHLKNNNLNMETKTKKGKMNHQLLIRMDDDLTSKLTNHSVVNDMSLSSVIRRSLRQFFEREEKKSVTGKMVKKQSPQL